jgi:hypothetical protein
MWRLPVISKVRDVNMELVGNASAYSNPVIALPEKAVQYYYRLPLAGFAVKKFHITGRENMVLLDYI